MPQYIIQWVVHHQNPLIVKQLDWNHEDVISIVNERVPHLNSQQSIVYQEVLSLVNEYSGATFFLDGPIGIGKTYVHNTIVIKLRSQGNFFICVASSSIVVFLIDGG
jgi:Cdc6-like AAA superfamily ATPase